METLRKLSVSEIAAALDQPFSMVNVALVGDLLVSVYICQGTMDWHRHLEIDELFWVHEGTILLESEWGEVRLQAGEAAVVPQGVGHRSGSEARASVLLLRCGLGPDRKNGRRRLYAISDGGALRRISLRQTVGLRQTTKSPLKPFRFQTVAQVDGSSLQVAWGEGTWPVEVPARCDLMLFVLDGTATVRTSQSLLHLHDGDFTVVPEGAVYQLSTTRGTVLVRAMHEGEPD